MDLPSDSDESDVDFVPGKEEEVSEAESEEADRETEAQYEDEVIKKKQKRTAKQYSEKNTRKKAKLSNEDVKESKLVNKTNKPNDSVSEKKYEDDLWASFLETPTPSKSIVAKKESKQVPSVVKTPVEKSAENNPNDKKKHDPDINGKSLEELFSTNKSETESSCESSTSLTSSKDKTLVSRLPVPPISSARRSGGGLSSILNKIGKKDKISTLEKTKLDWMNFKKDEGIDEDIAIHNRGKDGYLERQDFLQRTDLNQFEIEKSLRTNKRSNR